MAGQFSLSDAQNWLSANTGGTISAQPAQLTPGAQSDINNYSEGMAPQLSSGQLAPQNDWSQSPTNSRSNWGSVRDAQIDSQYQALMKGVKTPFIPANQAPKNLSSDISNEVARARQSHFMGMISNGQLSESSLPDLVKKGILTREDANMIIQDLAYVQRKAKEDQAKKNQPQQPRQPVQQTPGLFPSGLTNLLNPLSPISPLNPNRR